MGSNDAVLPESFLKNHTVNCLTYEQSIEKPYKEQSLPLQSTCSPLAWK